MIVDFVNGIVWVSVLSTIKESVNHVVSGSENHCPVRTEREPVRVESVSQKIKVPIEGSEILYESREDFTHERVMVHEKSSLPIFVISTHSSFQSNHTSVMRRSVQDTVSGVESEHIARGETGREVSLVANTII